MRHDDTRPRFWRDARLPFIEARSVSDGRQVCYAAHAHACFSIGAITAGGCQYRNGDVRMRIGAGSLVLMNPQAVHACNPIAGQPWAYLMLYVDAAWLGERQRALGLCEDGAFQPLAAIHLDDPGLYDALCQLHARLLDAQVAAQAKAAAAEAFFTRLLLTQATCPAIERPGQCERAAALIATQGASALSLDTLCTAAGLSPSQLIRDFRRHYGLTPHAYLINRRIQHGQHLLRQGLSLADAALSAGFADQAHFQRAFKKHLAATPGQYRAAQSINR